VNVIRAGGLVKGPVWIDVVERGFAVRSSEISEDEEIVRPNVNEGAGKTRNIGDVGQRSIRVVGEGDHLTIDIAHSSDLRGMRRAVGKPKHRTTVGGVIHSGEENAATRVCIGEANFRTGARVGPL